MARAGDQNCRSVGERGIGVVIIGKHARRSNVKRRILFGIVKIVGCDRSVIRLKYSDGHRRFVAVVSAVVGLVGKVIRAGEVDRRRISERTVRVEYKISSVGRGADEYCSQAARLAIQIVVVGEDARCANAKDSILVRAVEIVRSDGGVIDRADGDADRGNVGVQTPVVNLERKAIRTAKVCCRRISNRRRALGTSSTGHAIGCWNRAEAAVGGICNDAKAQRGVVDVTCTEGDNNRRIFNRNHCLTVCDRCVVDGIHRDRHAGGVRVNRSVAGLEAEAMGTIEISGRSVGNRRRAIGAGSAGDAIGRRDRT